MHIQLSILNLKLNENNLKLTDSVNEFRCKMDFDFRLGKNKKKFTPRFLLLFNNKHLSHIK